MLKKLYVKKSLVKCSLLYYVMQTSAVITTGEIPYLPTTETLQQTKKPQLRRNVTGERERNIQCELHSTRKSSTCEIFRQ